MPRAKDYVIPLYCLMYINAAVLVGNKPSSIKFILILYVKALKGQVGSFSTSISNSFIDSVYMASNLE